MARVAHDAPVVQRHELRSPPAGPSPPGARPGVPRLGPGRTGDHYIEAEPRRRLRDRLPRTGRRFGRAVDTARRGRVS